MPEGTCSPVLLAPPCRSWSVAWWVLSYCKSRMWMVSACRSNSVSTSVPSLQREGLRKGATECTHMLLQLHLPEPDGGWSLCDGLCPLHHVLQHIRRRLCNVESQQPTHAQRDTVNSAAWAQKGGDIVYIPYHLLPHPPPLPVDPLPVVSRYLRDIAS